MAKSFGGTIKLEGESDYQKALKGITSNLKLFSSELKLTNTEFSNGEKSIKQTKASYDNMNKAIQSQKTSISSLKDLIANMTKQYEQQKSKLSDLEKQYGADSKEVAKFKTELSNTEVKLNGYKTQLNNAENQLKQMESATDKSTKELKEMKKGFDDAGDGAVKFGDLLKANVLGDAIVGGIKALGSAVVGLGKVFVDVGKQALNSYADYEQLLGGVETLFGTGGQSAEEYAKKMGISVEQASKELDRLIDIEQEVISNSNNAYKTAGLSANEYLETVTSFSASLISSLGNDTAKAAKYADRAIIDMSDNANKMGTDIQMIQNAYQGFAKQNYTMLDNLKLGYGGTKTEMERLISDASKMKDIQKELGITVADSGKEFMSFGNIVNAISVIQKQWGITGTTAKEANETISGSLASMKSAWKNVLTGLGDDCADFGQLINNLVESIVTVGENIMPRVEIIIKGIVELIMGIVPKIVEYLPTFLQTGMTLLQTIFDGITSMIPQLMPVVVDIINNLVNFIVQNLPTILQAGITILVELVKGISQSLPELIPAMVDAVLLIVETLIDNIDLVIDAGIELILALADGLIEALPRLIEKAPIIIQKLVDALIRNFPKVITAGGQLIGELVMGISGAVWKLLEVAPQLISTLVNGIKNMREEIKNTGKYLVEGLWQGITNKTDWLYDKVKSFANNIVSNIKKALGIHSPSRVFRDEVGTNMALGLGEGFSDTMGDVTKEMQSAIPTSFDTDVNLKTSASSSSSSYDNMVNAFKKALSDVKVVMNDREMGTFITDTMEKVVYS